MTEIILGPILGYETDAGSSESWYTVIVRCTGSVAPTWEIAGQSIKMQDISGQLHDKTKVWRGEVRLDPFQTKDDSQVSYRVAVSGKSLRNVCGDSSWSFFLPQRITDSKQPKIAFCSCNGFSDPKSLGGLAPLAMWERMEKLHEKAPFHLLIMGGDQLYCDDLARREGSFGKFWSWLSPGKKPKAKPSPEEFKSAYFDQYLLAWCRVIHGKQVLPHTAMVRMMATVPSIMIWDDHDIFDGWGSYQAEDHKQPYYKEAFGAARTAFEAYQVRGGKRNRSLIDKDPGGPKSYSQAVSFGPFDILLMDNRSHRTPDQVMDRRQWSQFEAWLGLNQKKEDAKLKTLLVVSPVPVVYRRFYDWVADLPGEHGGEDDLRDHWSHVKHEGERDRLVSHLFDAFPGKRETGYKRVTILSGDVHVGALGFLENKETSREISQIVSSGIVHTPPGVVAWEGLKALSTDDDFAIKGQPVMAKMVRPVGAKDRYLRCRNFVWLKEGNDKRLWVNWECEPQKTDDPTVVEFGLR